MSFKVSLQCMKVTQKCRLTLVDPINHYLIKGNYHFDLITIDLLALDANFPQTYLDCFQKDMLSCICKVFKKCVKVTLRDYIYLF